jgi:glutathione synthase/RimK-type ligase-like ATP-grasp enzyme
MHNLKLYPYKMGSESAKDLAQYLDIKRVHPDGDYVPRIGHVILNWGNSVTPHWSGKAAARGVRILNKPQAVGIASDKLQTLLQLKRVGINVPEFTTQQYQAQTWINQGHTIVERHNLRGNSGEGIRIVSQEDVDDEYVQSNLEYAPLYTKFIPKTAEFRVHVFRGTVIDYIEKKKVATERRPANFNRHVSSVNLGWVFCRTNIMQSPEVKNAALAAVQALGLDFGAVDVVYHEGKPYVLEVNTAPGLAGTTLLSYVNAIRQFMGVSPLTQQHVNEIMDGVDESEPATPPVSASVAAPSPEVVLRLDRATAIKLQSLLAAQL